MRADCERSASERERVGRRRRKRNCANTNIEGYSGSAMVRFLVVVLEGASVLVMVRDEDEVLGSAGFAKVKNRSLGLLNPRLVMLANLTQLFRWCETVPPFRPLFQGLFSMHKKAPFLLVGPFT